ncbi:STAS domain-containing protein [Marinimicrobium alkaliphilum]|uniref:STAS domain-containing protein n=1 Tax=Marinimicrobium alkaliphilum TaxID=2202654 RepID=UPI001300AC72|nr:STAS domain-containing protein [Marinimicrobium alkaliphilum]
MTEQSDGVQTVVSDGGEALTIQVTGALDVERYRAFRQAYSQRARTYTRYRVDLSACTGIDSSGLGMLLILRDYTGLGRDALLLSGCSPALRQTLSYANFEQLFTIERHSPADRH